MAPGLGTAAGSLLPDGAAGLVPLAVPLLVFALALVVFVLDLVAGERARRLLGIVAAVGLGIILAASWRLPGGLAFGGAFAADCSPPGPWPAWGAWITRAA
jgi:hypothetical protein